MSIQGVNSQRPAVQPVQTQHATLAQPAQQAQQAQQADPLAALSKALEALEQAVHSLTSKGFNNNQTVAQQATQNLGQSGNSTGQGHNFDFSSLFQGGSTFQPAPAPQVQQAPVQQNTGTQPGFLDNRGGGGGGGDNHIHQFGDDRSGGGGRVDPGGANNGK